jgi:L-iditol 2-dehydrogenase
MASTQAASSSHGTPTTGSALAAVVRDDPRRVIVEQWALPELGTHDVRVRTRSVGICHSDMELVDGHLDGWMDISYPVVFGHEWAGDVVEIGEEVTNVSVGDRVTGCTDLGNNEWFGLTFPGAAAERFTIADELLHRIPDAMDYERGAMVEPFACVYQGLKVIGGADPSDAVCVVGAGTIGLCTLLAAKALGARTLVVEPSADRRALAADLGADAVLDPVGVDDLKAASTEALGGRGATLVVEAAGAGPALASALELSSYRGRVLFLGLCSDPAITCGLRLIQERNLRVAGSTGAPPEIWDGALRFLERTNLDLTPLITSRYPLDRATEAFAAARDTRSNLKVHIQVAD